MMSTFTALLEARDPSLGRFRAYLLEAGTDLFGAWLVDVTYGRIGTRGRRIRYVVQDENAARKLVRENLRRRATAERRIGVAYQFRQIVDPKKWCPVAVMSST
jgi:WGR domain